MVWLTRGSRVLITLGGEHGPSFFDEWLILECRSMAGQPWVEGTFRRLAIIGVPAAVLFTFFLPRILMHSDRLKVPSDAEVRRARTELVSAVRTVVAT